MTTGARAWILRAWAAAGLWAWGASVIVHASVAGAVKKNLDCMSHGLLGVLHDARIMLVGIACAALIAWGFNTLRTGRPDAGWLAGILAAAALAGFVGAAAGFFTGDTNLGDEIASRGAAMGGAGGCGT